jgi:hypothetical protein
MLVTVYHERAVSCPPSAPAWAGFLSFWGRSRHGQTQTRIGLPFQSRHEIGSRQRRRQSGSRRGCRWAEEGLTLMPLPKGTRYAMKKMKGGGYERLAFGKGGQVVEAKNMKTNKTHTPAEFKADRKKRGGK